MTFSSSILNFLLADKDPKIGSLDSKITQMPSATNFSSTTTSLNTCSPQNQIVQTATKIKALKDSKVSFYDFEASEELKFPKSQSFFQNTKVSLKEQIGTKFAEALKLKSQITSSSETFEKDYLFVEKIGRGKPFIQIHFWHTPGGEGEIHKVFHRPTNQYRAAKISPQKLRKDGSIEKAFNKGLLQEARILNSLDHPNIIKVYEVLQDFEQTAVVLEHLPGGSLLEHLNHPLFQSYEAIATIMEQLLSAVAYLHSNGIIHKDIKLENIMFEEASPFSNLKLIDFGYSENKDKHYTRSSSGTVMYMASEVFTMNYNEKVDIWSIGVILYLLLFKELPFSGKTSDDLVEDIFRKDLNALFEKRQKLCADPLIIPFLQKLLQRNPSKRYSAIDALSDPFIQKYAQKTQIEISDFQLLNIYQEKSAVELALSFVYMQNLMSLEEKTQFTRIFKALDVNKHGSIGIEDLKYLMDVNLKPQSTLNSPNTVKTGKIGFSHLIAACVNLRDKSVLRNVFVFLDKGNDLIVKVDKFMAILEQYVDKAFLDEMKDSFQSQKCLEVKFTLLTIF